MPQVLKDTPFSPVHRALGARMVPFAGYDMPLQFKGGVVQEHLWTREHAGVFDVSHMGPCFVRPSASSCQAAEDHAVLAAVMEPLISSDLQNLKPGRMRYTTLLSDDGGMLDDLMVARYVGSDGGARLYLVVNAAVKEEDFQLIAEACGRSAALERADDQGLLALQGPKAAAALRDLLPGCEALSFMACAPFPFGSTEVLVARCGYTGEDGYEVLTPVEVACEFYERLLGDERVQPVGLGARDSLRLEAGLPLYGQDADPSVSPVEAGLEFAVSRTRLRLGGIRGASRLVRELDGDLQRRRVGLRILQGAPARAGAAILSDGGEIGVVTSGGFSPSLSAPIAMGFVPPAYAGPGTPLSVRVRERENPAEVVALPFVPHRYVRTP